MLEGIYSSIHALARALKIEVLGCNIHYCSHVKSTSYSIAVKTKHGQTKFVSSICALNVKSRVVSENDRILAFTTVSCNFSSSARDSTSKLLAVNSDQTLPHREFLQDESLVMAIAISYIKSNSMLIVELLSRQWQLSWKSSQED